METQPKITLSEGEYYGMAIYLTLVGLVATSCNFAALVVFIKGKIFRRQGIDLLLINVAISDLGISIFGYPETTISSYAQKWLFGNIGCQLYAFSCFTLSMSTISSLVVISVYRYIMVCLPSYKHKLTRRRTAFAILGLWVYGLLWTTPPFFGWCSYTFEPFGTSCSMNWYGRTLADVTYIWGTIIFCFGIHYIVMTWCYINVMKRSKQVNPYKQPPGRQVERIIPVTKSQQKVSVMCLAMVASFGIAWTPYAVVSVVSVYTYDLPRILFIIPTMFAKSSCMMNPIIYFLSNSDYRKAFMKLFCPCVHTSKPNTPQPRQYYVRRATDDQSVTCAGHSSRLLYNNDGVYIGEIKPCKHPEYDELEKFEHASPEPEMLATINGMESESESGQQLQSFELREIHRTVSDTPSANDKRQIKKTKKMLEYEAEQGQSSISPSTSLSHNLNITAVEIHNKEDNENSPQQSKQAEQSDQVSSAV